jgi:hypothetical protein
MGFPISTNFISAGINYNITHNSWSVDKNGWSFNPSVSAMILEEQSTNLARGQGFRSNDQVLSRFVANGQQQKALDYFGFKGTYDPNAETSHFNSSNGSIHINNNALFINFQENGKNQNYFIINFVVDPVY